jgi:hypothetical protein
MIQQLLQWQWHENDETQQKLMHKRTDQLYNEMDSIVTALKAMNVQNYKEISSMKEMEAMVLREETSLQVPMGPQPTNYCAGEGHLLDYPEVKQFVASYHPARTLRRQILRKSQGIWAKERKTIFSNITDSSLCINKSTITHTTIYAHIHSLVQPSNSQICRHVLTLIKINENQVAQQLLVNQTDC